MFKNDFQELQRQIKPSDALIEQTKAKMQQALQEKLLNEENLNQENPDKKKFKKTMKIVYRTTATAACVMFVAVTGFYFNEVNKATKEMSHDSAVYNSSAKDSIANDILPPQQTPSSNEDETSALAPESNQSPSSTSAENTSVNDEPKPPTGESPSSTVEENPGSTVEENPGSTVDENPSSTVEENPGSTVDENPSSTVEESPGSTIDENPSSPVKEKPNTRIQTAPPSKSNTILTYLKPGVHSNSVRLNNGSLNFVSPEYSLKPANKFPQNKLDEWSQEQYFKYLGQDPRPAGIPTDLTPIYLEAESKLKVSVNKDGTLSNDITFSYGNTEKTKAIVQRQLKITTAKGEYPKSDLRFFFDKENASEIKDVPVNVGYQQKTLNNKKYDVYYAQFVYKDVGYDIESQSLTQEEFIDVLLSIIK